MRNQCSSVSIVTRLEARGFSLILLSRTALHPTWLSTQWVKKKIKLDRPLGFWEVEDPRNSRQLAHEDGRLSALYMAAFIPPRDTHGTHSCWRLSQPQGHSVGGRIKLMKNSSDRIWNQHRDLQACGAMPQITASLQPPTWWVSGYTAGNSSVSSAKVNNVCVWSCTFPSLYAAIAWCLMKHRDIFIILCFP